MGELDRPCYMCLLEEATTSDGVCSPCAESHPLSNQSQKSEPKLEDYPFSDGWPLPNGLVVSRAGNYCVAVYRCPCGREQTGWCPPFSGGLNMETVKQFGWDFSQGTWACPFCSGNKDKLDKIFQRGATL